MKKIFLLLIFITLAFSAFSQNIWTVQTVPNTRLQSNDIHVSDPDGYLSDSVEMSINTALCAIRDTADVFVVTLTSIGDAEPKRFATELFNYWGIGDAQKDNGVLLLFVEDQHALEFETGYGAEATLTDAKCERIFTKTIVPFFKAGDYEGGLSAGVAQIVKVYGGDIPMGLKTDLPPIDDYEEEDSSLDDMSIVFLIFAFAIFFLPLFGIIFWAIKRKTKSTVSEKYSAKDEGGATYVEGFKTSWSGSPWDGKGCLGGLMIGLSIFVCLFIVILFLSFFYPDLEEKKMFDIASIGALLLYLTWICFRHNHRVLKTADQLVQTSVNPKSVYEAATNHKANKVAMWMAPWLGWVYYLIFKKKVNAYDECQCPKCGGVMRKDGMYGLPENHLAENRVGAMKFTPYRCVNGHSIVVKEHGKHYSDFTTCSKCGAYTLKLTQTETIRQADYSRNGEKKETYVCQHCGEVIVKTIVIPRLVHYSSGGGSSYSSGSSGRSYSSHSSSHSSGGSFGGGRSGGGGYSGRW
jgi:uncharacterized protein